MDLKEGDIVLLESKDLKLCGPVSFVGGEIIYLGDKKSYNTRTKILSIKQEKKLRQFAEVELASNEEAMELLSSVVYKELLKDEIYFFFNNDPNKDHLDSDIMDGSTNGLSLCEIENIVKLIIPYGRGEYGFTDIEQVKKQAVESIKEGKILHYVFIRKGKA